MGSQVSAIYEARQTFAVPATSGQYAPERITFMPPAGPAGIRVDPLDLVGVTALIESNTATGAVLELWLPKVGTVSPGVDADYVYSGKGITSGAETWPLASYPGAQLRARSAGTAGSMAVSASAD